MPSGGRYSGLLAYLVTVHGGAVLEEAFLEEREAQMEAVLSAWTSSLSVHLDEPSGPEALLAFLSREFLPGLGLFSGDLTLESPSSRRFTRSIVHGG